MGIDSILEGLKSSLSSGSWTAQNPALEDVHVTLKNIIWEKRWVEASSTVQGFIRMWKTFSAIAIEAAYKTICES